MPTKYTATEWLKLYTGSTGAHVMWEREKKQAGKVVDVSVFKDGLGPAMDTFAKALHAVNLARQKQSTQVTRQNGKNVYGPKYGDYSTATDKARRVLVDKTTRLNRVVAEYVKLCDAKKANPADKLTKPAGPTAAAAQTRTWESLGKFLRETQATIAAIPEIAKMNDQYQPFVRDA